MKKSVKKQKPKASLDYGRLFSDALVWYLRFTFVFVCLATMFVIVVAAIYKEWRILWFVLFAGLIIPTYIYLLKNYQKHWALVRLWMKDAVELDAEIRQVAPLRAVRGRAASAFSVTFVYNDEVKNILRDTSFDDYAPQTYVKGIQKDFRRFVYMPAKVKILYSPSYDKVMFC